MREDRKCAYSVPVQGTYLLDLVTSGRQILMYWLNWPRGARLSLKLAGGSRKPVAPCPDCRVPCPEPIVELRGRVFVVLGPSSTSMAICY